MCKNLLLFIILAMTLIYGCKTEEQITVIQKQKHTELIKIDLNSEAENRDAEYLIYRAIDDGVRDYVLFVPVKNIHVTNNATMEKHQKHTAIPVSPEATTELLEVLKNNIQLWGEEISENDEVLSSYHYTAAFETRHITGCGFQGCNRTPAYSAFRTLHIIDSTLPTLQYDYSYSESSSSSSLRIMWKEAEWEFELMDKNSLIILRDLLQNARESINNYQNLPVVNTSGRSE